MKVGDRVVMSPMWKYSYARGVVIKVNKQNCVVVKWDNIPGEWFYTSNQVQDLHLENKSFDEKKNWKVWGDK